MSEIESRRIISERAIAENVPISIATGIAIESSLGLLEEANDEHAPVLDRDQLIINISTLFRNFIGSIPTEKRGFLTPFTLAESLAGEMRVIEQVINEGSEGRCMVVFYHCSYDTLYKKFTKSLPKISNTVLQKDYDSLEKATLGELKESILSKPPIEYYDVKIALKGGKTLMLSHYPVDLLNRYNFQSLSLLESHTGAIKPPQIWYTKLKDGKDLKIIPFDRMTMQMFGDGVHFSPMPIKIRKLLYNIAVKNKWTAITTKDMIIHSVTMNRDPALEVLVKDLYRH